MMRVSEDLNVSFVPFNLRLCFLDLKSGGFQIRYFFSCWAQKQNACVYSLRKQLEIRLLQYNYDIINIFYILGTHSVNQKQEGQSGEKYFKKQSGTTNKPLIGCHWN